MANDNNDTLLQGFYLNQWLIDPAHGRFETKGHRIHIEPKVMDVLLCLARNYGQVVSRAELLDEVWRDLVVSEEVLTRCISELRTALNDTHRERKFIRTVPKRGYCLIVAPTPVDSAAETSAPPPASDEQAEPIDTAIEQAYADTPPPSSGPRRSFFHRWIGQETVFALAFLAIFLGYKWGADKLQLNEDSSDAEFLVADDMTSAGIVPGVSGEVALDVVVLPFVNISAEDDYFSIGLAEDIRNKLIRTKGLRVAARTSSEVFLGQAQDIRDIGKALNARTVVEGTVRMDESRIRLTVQLSETENGHPLWAETYERDRLDIFALQEEIATDVVKQLAPALSQPETTSADGQPNSVQAYDNYLLGRFHWNKRTPQANELAKTYFQKAIDLDPNYAAAYAGLADSELVLPKYQKGAMPEEESQRVGELINKALSLNPTDSEANASRGLLAQLQSDYDTAEAYYRRALELNPNNSMALMWYGNLKNGQALPLQALEKFKAAINLDPLHPSIQSNYLGALLTLGRNQELQSLAPYFYSINHQENILRMQLGAYLSQGQFTEALAVAQNSEFTGMTKEYVRIEIALGLIALQRYDQASEMIQAINASEKIQNNIDDLKATMALAQRDIPRLASIIDRVGPVFEDSSETCDHAYYWTYKGILSWFDNQPEAARQSFSQSLAAHQSHCNDGWKNIEALSYLILIAKSTSDDSQAEQHYQAGLDLIKEAKERGIGHYGLWLTELKLHLAMQEHTEAHNLLDHAQSEGRNFYGWLIMDPIFQPIIDELLATSSGQPVHPLIKNFRKQQNQRPNFDLAGLKS